MTNTSEPTDGRTNLVYYVTTGIVTLIMTFSVGNYLFNHEFVREAFMKMGYPTYIVYPLAIAKILGLIAIWSRVSPLLTGLAYAGFFYDLVLAILALTYPRFLIHQNLRLPIKPRIHSDS
ncbi:MAG: DoxX family protein [bacterium]|nr:DoxX family protein [bacterium]